MKYIKLYEVQMYGTEFKYDSLDYVCYIKTNDIYVIQGIDNDYAPYFARNIKTGEETWFSENEIRKLEPWEVEALKYNL